MVSFFYYNKYMEYYSLNQYLKDTYGKKVYKLAIDAGFSCPNRDGSIGHGGCIFCSGMGSGDFAGNRSTSITAQIEAGKARVESKMPLSSKSGDSSHTPDGSYIAYFQAYTNTYAPVDILRSRYMEAINHPDIVGLAIATRPDCLDDHILELIDEINHIKPVWIELGLQTIHPATATYIRRGYELSVYDDAVARLSALGIHIVTHVILGLPGEDRDMMLSSVKHVASLAKSLANPDIPHQFGIKLQLLHVIEGTDLASDYKAGLFDTLTLEEYTDIVVSCLKELPPDMVVHRITGDGAKKTLLAPLWSADKKRVLNTLNAAIRNAK